MLLSLPGVVLPTRTILPNSQPTVVQNVLWGVTGSWEGGQSHAAAVPVLR